MYAQHSLPRSRCYFGLALPFAALSDQLFHSHLSWLLPAVPRLLLAFSSFCFKNTLASDAVTDPLLLHEGSCMLLLDSGDVLASCCLCCDLAEACETAVMHNCSQAAGCCAFKIPVGEPPFIVASCLMPAADTSHHFFLMASVVTAIAFSYDVRRRLCQCHRASSNAGL